MTTFLLIFLATALGIGVVGQVLFPARSGAVDNRLKAYAGPGAHSALPARLENDFRRKLLRGLGGLVEPVVSRFGFAARLDDLMQSAGVPMRASEFLVASLGAAAVGALVGQVLMGPAGLTLAAAAGAYAPLFQVKRMAQARQKVLNEQLPDALMLMVNALRAGNSLTQAMHAVGQQMPAPINITFGAALQEINFGLPVEEALQNLQARFGGSDMGLVTAAISVQRETGGNLAEILQNLHGTIRDRQTVQGEMKALTATGRMSGWVLSFLPVGIGFLFFLLNRNYILTLFVDPRGQMLTGCGVILIVIGMLAIRKIVNVEY